jgi:hypothetical protein
VWGETSFIGPRGAKAPRGEGEQSNYQKGAIMNNLSTPCPECGGTLILHSDGRKCGCEKNITHVFRYPSMRPIGETLSRIVLRDLNDSHKTAKFMDENNTVTR